MKKNAAIAARRALEEYHRQLAEIADQITANAEREA